MLERISKITERWFLCEEPLFSVFCTHRVAENSGMQCHVRVGKGVIEVNPILCEDISDKELEERLRIEVIRILLKHPYDRQPDGCSLKARAMGSNCVIADSYRLQKVELEKPVVKPDLLSSTHSNVEVERQDPTPAPKPIIHEDKIPQKQDISDDQFFDDFFDD